MERGVVVSASDDVQRIVEGMQLLYENYYDKYILPVRMARIHGSYALRYGLFYLLMVNDRVTGTGGVTLARNVDEVHHIADAKHPVVKKWCENQLQHTRLLGYTCLAHRKDPTLREDRLDPLCMTTALVRKLWIENENGETQGTGVVALNHLFHYETTFDAQSLAELPGYSDIDGERKSITDIHFAFDVTRWTRRVLQYICTHTKGVFDASNDPPFGRQIPPEAIAFLELLERSKSTLAKDCVDQILQGSDWREVAANHENDLRDDETREECVLIQASDFEPFISSRKKHPMQERVLTH